MTNDKNLMAALLGNGDNDILEQGVQAFDEGLLRLLLLDMTTKQNILWGTDNYAALGEAYHEDAPILPELITGEHARLIQPRMLKPQDEQLLRTRDKAEVFTPSWVCNKQNNLVDERWFKRDVVFNTEEGTAWRATRDKISFDGAYKSWRKYVDTQRLEISCGEAPYLVSRYDTVSGTMIPLSERIGLFDRKMRVLSENAESDADWLAYSLRALQSIYGYEYQGDNLLLARENLLLSYVEYYHARFDSLPDKKLLRKAARIIAWNLWQMDGLKGVVPGSCKHPREIQYNLMGESISQECPGCLKNDLYSHIGTLCKIQDWRTKEPIRFVDMMRSRRKKNVNA